MLSGVAFKGKWDVSFQWVFLMIVEIIKTSAGNPIKDNMLQFLRPKD